MTILASDSVCIPQQEEGLDLFAQLPDELLVKVVSCLTLTQAVRTSILSSRWINLWKSADLVLEFDASKFRLGINGTSLVWPTWQDFRNWVNGVVTQMQHNASKLTKFRVLMDLNEEPSSKTDVDRWVEFAISKRVEFLDVYLSSCLNLDHYVFSEGCYNRIRTPTGLSEIRSLKSLRLRDVQVRTEILEHFIANCPLLEELALSINFSLTVIRVVGSSSNSPLRLKYLELRECPNLKSFEIDHTPHLVRFVYGLGPHFPELRVGKCPALVDVNLEDACYHANTFNALLGCASGLESLSMKWDPLKMPLSDRAGHARLKRLTVEVLPVGLGSFLGLVPLINACPRLHTLQVTFPLEGGVSAVAAPDIEKTRRESIKVVEIYKFHGHHSECEFVEYVMEYFVGLERVLVVPYRSMIDDLFGYCDEMGRSQSVEECQPAEKIALGFKSKAPPTLEFTVV